MNKYLTIFLICIFSVSPVFATTPEELTKKYYELMQSNKWEETVNLYDVKSLKEFKRSVTEYMNQVTEKEAEEMYTALFGRKVMVSDIPVMSAQEFYNGYFRSTRIRLIEVGKIKLRSFKVLGSVSEGKNIRHVVVRKITDAEAYDIESYEILSMVFSDNVWRLIPSPEVMALGKKMMTLLTKKK
jgi:hypothetical protein